MASRLIRAFSLLSASCLLLAAGCIFSPERKPPKKPVPFDYLPPISPGNVLQNLVSAYNNRDSVETALVYDDTYTGVSTDPSAQTPVPDLHKPDEIHHVKRLHDDHD